MTSTGPYSTAPYFIRLSKTGDPNAAITYNLGNGSITADQRAIVDQGFLELVRLGVLPASDPDVQNSLSVIDSTIEVEHPERPGLLPLRNQRSGLRGRVRRLPRGSTRRTARSRASRGRRSTRAQIRATSARGTCGPSWAASAASTTSPPGTRPAPSTFLTAMRNMTSGQGLEPEQAWEDPDVPASPFGTDPTTASIGFADGQPAGSASPLTWAQSQYARLALALSTGRNLETPGIVTRRYVDQRAAGIAAAHRHVERQRLDSHGDRDDRLPGRASTPRPWAEPAAPPPPLRPPPTARATGPLMLPAGFGGTTVTVTATLHRSTGYTQLSVTNVSLPGNQVLDVTDPPGDDNGPGTYAYPLNGVFVPARST